MLTTVLEILLMAFIMAGLFYVIHKLHTEEILFCPEDGEVFIVVPVKGEQQSAEQRLRLASSIARRYGGSSGMKVLAVDIDAGKDSREICGYAAKDNEFVYICSHQELSEILGAK